MEAKTCFKCCRKLPLDQFYAHPRMRDGHLNKCVSCTRRDAKAHRLANLARVRLYDRERGYRTKRDRQAAHNAARTTPTQACSECGAKTSLERHHPDYSRPREVIVLCRPHHRARHRRYATAEVF